MGSLPLHHQFLYRGPLADVLFAVGGGHQVGEFVGGTGEDGDAKIGEELGVGVVVAGGAVSFSRPIITEDIAGL